MKDQFYLALTLSIVFSLIQGGGCSSINKPISLALTIYNDGFAMVKDTRSISFDKGLSSLYFTDVSPNIQTETVTFKALSKPQDIKVFEQNYEKNLVNTNGML